MICKNFLRGAALAAALLMCAPLRAEVIISGAAKRPFPALIGLDYPYTRAKAWLDALASAQNLLPQSVAVEQGMLTWNKDMGGKAAAALLFPVEAVTPDLAPGEEIKIFLKDNSQNLATALADLKKPGAMPLSTLLLLEVEELLTLTEKNWPETVRDADAKTPNLEILANALNGLWLAKAGSPPAPDLLEQALNLAPQSHLLALWDAELALTRNLPQAALAKAAKIEQRALLQASLNPKSRPVWEYLATRARLARARAHMQLDQNALAEQAFNEALQTLKSSGVGDDTAGAILLERAALRKTRQDYTGMCQDYLAACAAGQCDPLALARRNGQCNPS